MYLTVPQLETSDMYMYICVHVHWTHIIIMYMYIVHAFVLYMYLYTCRHVHVDYCSVLYVYL